MFNVTRDPHNPLVSPHKNHAWQDVGTPNGSPIKTPDGKDALVYRAIGSPDRLQHTGMTRSSVGCAVSDDGNFFENNQQLIDPQEEWEQFGCEDPRVTKIGDTYYIFYTAISEYPYKPEGIRCAVATTKDLQTIESRSLVTPFNAKAMCLFPETVDGKYTVMLSVNTDYSGKERIGIAQFEDLETLYDQEFWSNWYEHLDEHTLHLKRDDTDHAEVGAVPLMTDDGWLMVYSHIKNYYTDNKVFGIEAVLLNPKNPLEVTARTQYPFIVPEEIFDTYGYVGNVTFPTGAVIEGDRLDVYYGGSDTTTNRASLPLGSLISAMKAGEETELFERVDGNPVLEPNENSWEDRDVFNPAAVDIDGTVYILYRAMSQDNTSVVGLATSKDGVTINERLPEPIYVPRIDYEQKKGSPTGNSGCEDPRITRIRDTLYMCYTAYNGIEVPRIAMTTISVDDFVARQWDKWSEPMLVSPEGIDDKDGCLLEEKVDGRYYFIHRLSHHICGDFIDDPSFASGEKLDQCIEMVHPRPGMWDGLKVGISGPPHLTEHGWLLFYHGVSEDKFYRVGAVLFDRDDPSHIIGRTALPIFGPREEYEKVGEIGQVVFPCGSVIRDDTVYLYYGGADRVVGIATGSLNEILKSVGIE